VPRLRKNTDFSFWEQKGWLEERDIVIIGAGFVGLSAAIECRKNRPYVKITILEASGLNGGGSTRNAGFACFGSPSELLDDWKTIGKEKTVELVARRWEGLKWLRDEFSDESIGYEATGSLEMFTPDQAELEAEVRAFLPELNEALKGVFGEAPFTAVEKDTVITSPLEGILDTALLYRAVKQKALEAGVDILCGVEVLEIVKAQAGYKLVVDGGEVEAAQVLVANNAMAAGLIEELDVKPYANRVIVTNELKGLEFHGSCHYDRGYVYFRRVGDRMLIGGGRQWGDGESEEVREKLLAFLRTHVKGASEAVIEYEWIGYLGIGSVRDPIVKTLAPGLHVGVRMQPRIEKIVSWAKPIIPHRCF
jgi:gamma-glutamylputrescine oxidase